MNNLHTKQYIFYSFICGDSSRTNKVDGVDQGRKKECTYIGEHEEDVCKYAEALERLG